MNSELSDIHVLILCYDVDVKTYGFEKILERFIYDLNLLEGVEGVTVEIEGQDFTLRATISLFTGDTLAAHQVFNLLGPSGNHFCRECMISRDDLINGRIEVAQSRSKELYDYHLKYLEDNNYSASAASETGIKGKCALHGSTFFHISNNKAFDLLHDYLLGVGPMVLKLVLHKHIIEQKKFNIQFFNGRITAFNYGYAEMKNKPSANFTDGMLRKNENTLSQKGMQMWLLLRVYPFLISDKIPEGDEYLELVTYLLRIMELVFAPKIFKSLIPYLKVLISDFAKLFKQLFPEVDFINKFHHMFHHPENILWSGPMYNFWCMRYDAKHNTQKVKAKVVNNFKNAPKTLIRAPQCIQSAKWGKGNVKLHRTDGISGSMKLVVNLDCRKNLLDLGFKDMDSVFCCSSVRVDGTEYRKGLYVCLEAAHMVPENVPIFGHVLDVIMLQDSDIYLEIATCSTFPLDTWLNAYPIETNDDDESCRILKKILDLTHYKPLSAWRKPNSDELFISLRHIILSVRNIGEIKVKTHFLILFHEKIFFVK